MLSLFSSGYGQERGVHSFPTRRSSDLIRQTRNADSTSRMDTGMAETTYLEAITQAMSEEMARDERVFLIGDRKSTRLNSSHSQISYAVFCLKKKINGGLAYSGRPHRTS